MPFPGYRRNVAAVADELAGWRFTVTEVSAGAYRGRGVDLEGRSVELTLGDPEEVLRLLRERAQELVDRDV